MRTTIFAVVALVLLLLLPNTSSAQIQVSAQSFFEVDITGVLEIAESQNGTLSGLVKGTTYILDPNPDADPGIQPFTGNEDGDPVLFEITADGGANVTISFLLPTQLVGEFNAIPCSFGSASAMHVEVGERWDPNSPHNLVIGSGGVGTIGLGISVTTTLSAAPGDTYLGYVTCTAAITGL